MTTCRIRHWLVLVLVVALGPRALAQEKGQDAFFLDRAKSAAVAAAQLPALGQPFGVLALYGRAQHDYLWPAPVFTEAPPLSEYLLSFVRDDRVFLDFRNQIPENLRKGAWLEKRAYVQALVQSQRTAADLFQKSAAENRKLYFTHLYTEPGRHRGLIIPLEGRLKKLVRFDAPAEALDQGVRFVWEGWVFLKTPGTPPVIVHLAKLPDEMEEGERVDYSVQFEGYFFKKYPYKDAAHKQMTTLLFIGPTVRVEPQASRSEGAGFALSSVVIGGVVGLLGGTILLVGLLSWAFGRSDRRIRERIRQVRATRLGDDAFANDLGTESSSVPSQAEGDSSAQGIRPKEL